YLEAANGLLGLGALAATVTKNERLATALGAYAAYNTTKLMAYGYADNLFPSRAQRLQIETTRRRFLEDSDPDGAITAIRIVPANKGWALDKLVLDLMGAAVQVGVPSETFGELVGWAAFAEISTRATQRGVSRIRVPAQTFCAVDISDPAHHRIHVMDAANAPFVRSGALGYRARATGEATLYVSSEPSFFGHVFAAELVRLSVEPIRVSVSPGSSTVAPGERVRLWASVTGAEDPTLDWVLEGGAADLSPIGTQAPSVDVTTGVTEASYPVRLRATPRTRTGLRGLPDAPARDGFGVIETALPRIAASPLCLEPGETHRFEAIWPHAARTLTIFADGSVDAGSAAALRPVWAASAGRIDATGLYTAPDARGRDVTITLADAAAPALTASRRIRIGNCTCFWEVSLGGQRFSGYWTYFPVVLDSRFDRGGDGVLDLFPMADNRFGPKDEPVTSELRLRTLLVNHPRSEPGPSLTLTFDPPIDGRRGGTSRMSGGMSAETTPGLHTDLTRLYAFTGNIGADAVYVLGRDSVDMEIAAEFTRFADGEAVDRRLAVVRLRARAGYGPASACEGPDAPLPRLPIGDALPSLPTLPRVDR
ncbi:hypothetical protein, partial [Salinarimonas ramus]|uniref:hypothetical protein n=1 Tax=Salinarimonas ramus TaxID=690164 RepID=UPI00166CF573